MRRTAIRLLVTAAAAAAAFVATTVGVAAPQLYSSGDLTDAIPDPGAVYPTPQISVDLGTAKVAT